MDKKHYEKPKTFVLQVAETYSILTTSPSGNAGGFDDGGEDGDDVPPLYK